MGAQVTSAPVFPSIDLRSKENMLSQRCLQLAARMPLRLPVASQAMVRPLSRFCGTAAPAADCEELRAKAAELREQIKDLEDKRLSVLSDSRQAQKRHGADLENELKYGITKFAKEMLKIADNLDRASSSV